VSARKPESPRPSRAKAESRPSTPAGAARRSTPGRAAATVVEPGEEPPRRRRRPAADGDGVGAGAGNGNGNGNGGGVRTVARRGESRRGGRAGDDPLRRLADAMRSVRDGDFTRRLGASGDPAFDEVFALYDDTARLRAC
jgi:hypothetical protein